MRYRIQIEPLLGAIIVVVSELDQFRGVTRTATKMYTLDAEVAEHGGFVEILGELQRLVAESQS
jgi:hypothetical protein